MGAIVKNAKKYCMEILATSRCHKLPFHNGQHTLDVYENAYRIGQHECLSEIELEPVLLAALFHDTGNAVPYEDHEERSVSNAVIFLENEGYEKHLIGLVTGCIRATKIPQRPLSKQECILCDADLYHLGRKDFFILNDNLRIEWEQYHGKYYTNAAWYALKTEFMKNHNFHTTFGKLL
ncbi:MAG TPA: HD domain-containing protein [Eudoraea sp.]|nr:HD domain-containing protein [Eudoraea sp.]